jgi:hypothetical protein
MKRVILFLLIAIGLIFANGCYWIFSDIQTRCIKKIESNQPISVYEKASILTLHAGICTVGVFYCKEAAYANFKMLITDKDTVYMHSENWITPKIKARFKNKELGRMTWNGNVDYAFSSPEKDGAILLNWCELKEQTIDGKPCYVAECDYTWKVPSKTTFKVTDSFSIVLYEHLFYELEKMGILHPFKLICYYECEK